jgi:hypothetical protein
MTAPALPQVNPHVSEDRGYMDEQIKDLDNALKKAEAAVYKLRDAKSSSVRGRRRKV